MSKEDKKAVLQCYPEPLSKEIKGYVDLANDHVVFCDNNDKEIIRIACDTMIDCKISTFTGHGFLFYHYYYFIIFYKEENNVRELTFRVGETELPHFKELHSRVEAKLPPDAFKEKIRYDEKRKKATN